MISREKYMSNSEHTAKEIQRRQIRLVCQAAQLVLENGGEVYRVEETALRMAKGFDLEDVNIVAFPTSLFLDAGGRMRVRRITHRGVNTTRLALVNDISRKVEHGEMPLEEAERALSDIANGYGAEQKTLIPGYALAAASFALMFGGGLGSMIAALLIGALVQTVQPLFSYMAMGGFFGNFTGGVITAFLAHAAALFIPYGDVNATIIGGIMPLLTGLLMTTAVRDTMYGDLVSGIVRALEALLLAASVALGVYIGLKLIALTGGVAL